MYKTRVGIDVAETMQINRRGGHGDPITGGHGDPPLQDVIARLKSFTTHQYRKTLWQRSFYDHIIRNEKDYIEHYTYIENNPVKWEMDELHV